MFRHPKYYKELRKLRNRVVQSSRTDSPQSDQVISANKLDGDMKVRAPGPGLKQQAIEETVPHNDIEEATSSQASSGKHQAPSNKRKASSHKRQAP